MTPDPTPASPDGAHPAPRTRKVRGVAVLPGATRWVARVPGALVGVLLVGGLLACAPVPTTVGAGESAVPASQPAAVAPGSGLLDGSLAEAWGVEVSTPMPGSAPVPTVGAGASAAPAGPESRPPRRQERRRVIGLPTGVGDQAAAAVAAPRRVEVPRLGIDSSLDRLGLRRDAELEAPRRWGRAGWFTGAPRPGERGPAVIAGHLDSPSGPAVFSRLPAVELDDRIVVTDEAGTTHTFAVTRVSRTPKVGFPTEAVYGSVPGAELRLITCTGDYVAAEGGYQDNLLVFASLVRG